MRDIAYLVSVSQPMPRPMKEHERLRKKLEELSKGDLKENKEEYQEIVLAYIVACNEDDELEQYDFSSLTFPEISFVGSEFNNNVDFRGATFWGYADFRGATFSSQANFSGTTFSGEANFHGATFEGDAYLRTAAFEGYADFFSAAFKGYADFFSATFSGEADFRIATFWDEANFRIAKFSGEANFLSATFSGSAHFQEATFEQRAEYVDSIFHNEVHFEEASFVFLKTLPGEAGEDEYKLISLEGAVLEAAHLWGIDTLHNYIFKNAFLLGVSLAGKTLAGCDLTGAVMKNVHTDGMKLDEETVRNTKFIYTDYRKEGRPDDEGQEREVYVPIEESRVPADGFFGEASNEGFTARDYFHKPYEWNYAIGLQPELRDTILNVVQFFKYYAEKAKAEHVDIDTRTEGSKVRILFQVEEEADRERVERLFQDYIDKIFSLEGFEVEFENPDLTDAERADVQRRAEFLQRTALIEYGIQLQLHPGQEGQFGEYALLPILRRERAEMQAFAVELANAMSQAGPKNLTLHSDVDVVVNVKVPEISLKLYDLIDQLEAAELGRRKKEGIQEELEQVLQDLKAQKTQAAKSRWEVVWTGLKEITGFTANFPKLFELGEIIQGMF